VLQCVRLGPQRSYSGNVQRVQSKGANQRGEATNCDDVTAIVTLRTTSGTSSSTHSVQTPLSVNIRNQNQNSSWHVSEQTSNTEMGLERNAKSRFPYYYTSRGYASAGEDSSGSGSIQKLPYNCNLGQFQVIHV
jgi:hypothetical protein